MPSWTRARDGAMRRLQVGRVARMPSRGFRWEYVALAAVLTLAVLCLAYYSYENLGVKKPLEKALLADADVASVRVTVDNGVRVLEIAMRDVPDLSASYARLYAIAEDRMGGAAFKVQIADQRDTLLETAYHSIHYYLEEASVRGSFGAMIEQCSGILTRAGVTDFKITVDERHIFVQMAGGQSYLYQVLDRSGGSRGGAVQ